MKGSDYFKKTMYCGARRAQVWKRECGKVMEGYYVTPWHLEAKEHYVLSSPHTGNQTIYGGLRAERNTGVRRKAPDTDPLIRGTDIKGGESSLRRRE